MKPEVRIMEGHDKLLLVYSELEARTSDLRISGDQAVGEKTTVTLLTENSITNDKLSDNPRYH
jgi:hypothetical protein